MLKFRCFPKKILFALIIAFIGGTIVTKSAGTQPIDNTLVEQYKAYLSDLGNIGSRYATAQTFYATIIATLIAIFSFKEINRPIQDYLSSASIVVFLFIAIICYLWWDTLQFYHDLFDIKLELLRQMETENHRLFPLFNREHDLYPLRGLTERDSHVAIAIGCTAGFLALVAFFYQIYSGGTHKRRSRNKSERTRAHREYGNPK